MKIFLFIASQLLGLAIIAAMYVYAFANWPANIAWLFISLAVVLYLGNLMVSLKDMWRRHKLAKNFHW